MKKYTYTIYGTFEIEIEASSEEEAKSHFDIGDADITIQGCFKSDEEEEE